MMKYLKPVAAIYLAIIGIGLVVSGIAGGYVMPWPYSTLVPLAMIGTAMLFFVGSHAVWQNKEAT